MTVLFQMNVRGKDVVPAQEAAAFLKRSNLNATTLGQVRPVLLNSGLPSTALARIWELADMDKDGKLDRIEMSVALHLVYCALQGEPVPDVLPPSLIHPTKRELVQFSSSVPPVLTSQWSGGRQRTSSVVSLEGPEHPTSESERVRPQSVQPTAVTTPTIF
ncbi:unnamed protein product, partial [Brugia timori]|uniref:Epidermal growth factor receptor substrate 15-like 1 n=1 Tax=Brugia timori TaxID=42155 RepID=A0A0R3QLT6_9BILA